MSKEFAVVIGDSRLFQADAIETFAPGTGTAETFVVCRARTKRFIPYGPSGDAVLKRIHIAVTHRDGCSFDVTPFRDGRPLHALKGHFSALPSATAWPVRSLFILPVSIRRRGGLYTTGVRGTSFGVEIEATSPAARFDVEITSFETIPLNIAKATGEGR